MWAFGRKRLGLVLRWFQDFARQIIEGLIAIPENTHTVVPIQDRTAAGPNLPHVH